MTIHVMMFLFGLLLGALLGTAATFMYMANAFARDVEGVLDDVAEQLSRAFDE